MKKNLNKKQKFTKFVLSFKKEDSVFGDLAKDVIADKSLPKEFDYNILKKRIQQCAGPFCSGLKVAEAANKMFKIKEKINEKL